MTATEQYYKTVKSCPKPLPVLPSGESAIEVFEAGKEVYNNPKYMNEAGYAEFAQLFEQKLKEGHEYCGGATIRPQETSKKSQTQKIINGLVAISDLLTGEKREKTQKIIKGLEAIKDLLK